MASVVTDVTEFVKTQGEGKYYGIAVPYYPKNNARTDQVGGWKLIVLEENDNLELRKATIKFGARNISVSEGTEVEINADGILFDKTDALSADLMISSVGGDPDRKNSYLKFYPNTSDLNKEITSKTDDLSTQLEERLEKCFFSRYYFRKWNIKK